MKHILFIALAWIVLATNAQTISFDSLDYKSIGVYDTWEESPFRTGALEGNAKIIANHLNQIDPILEKAPNASANIVGLQRSHYGSNTFGLRVDLKTPFRLTKKARYVHVLIYKPVESRVLVCGLGKRTEAAWSWQDGSCEQFKVASDIKTAANTWVDVVLPINGFSYAESDKDGIDISSLVICPDLRSPQVGEEDFACYIDQIEINDDPKPRFSTKLYALNFEEDLNTQRGDRHLDSISLGTQKIVIEPGKVYRNLVGTAMFSAKAGTSVTPKFYYTGAYMSGYTYVDWNNDGKFTYSILANGRPATGSEIVSYSAYNPNADTGTGANSWLKSNGTTASNGNTVNSAMPAFTIPSATPNGLYRMRYKVDWNNIDPAGNATQGNQLPNNGGAVIDVLLDVHPTQIHITEGSLNGQILTADAQPLDNVYVPYGKPYTIKIDPYPGFSHNGVVIRSGYNTSSTNQYVNNNPQYLIHTFGYEDFDENGLLTIPAEMMIGGEVYVEGQFIEALKQPYTVKVSGNPAGTKGGVMFKNTSYYDNDQITTDHTISQSAVSAIAISGYNAILTIEDLTISVEYTNAPIKGDTITALSQLSNTKAYFITSLTGEGTLVYNPALTTEYVSIKASNGCVQGFPNDAAATAVYQSAIDTFSLNDSWQILQKNSQYYLYNPGAKAFVTLSGRDYMFTNEETALKEIRTNSSSETTSVNGNTLPLSGTFSFLGKNGDNTHYACICTGTTPQALRNWTYNDHGSVFVITENPNIDVTDIFDDINGVIGNYSPIDTTTDQGAPIYNIYGQRLKSIPEKGIYIINRRKYRR